MLAIAPTVRRRERRCTLPDCCRLFDEGQRKAAAPPEPALICRRPCIPTALRRRLQVLLHQQLWLWGLDIRRPEGNALIAYGFARSRPPEGERGSNTYTYCHPNVWGVTLWAFGLHYHTADVGGIVVPRYTATPRLVPAVGLLPQVWSTTQLTNCRAPRGVRDWARARQLYIAALRWIAAYEAWILALRGLAYRRECVAAWPKTRVSADTLVVEWATLADACDEAMQTFIAIRS